MNDVLTEVRFWQIVLDDTRKTIIINPELESRVLGWLRARDLDGFHKVACSDIVPETVAYVTPLYQPPFSFRTNG